MRQRLLGAVGMLGVTLGLVLLLWPGLAAAVTVRHLLVSMLGALAVLQALAVLRRGLREPVEAGPLPTVERRYDVPVPGDEFDTLLSDVPERRGVEATRRKDQLRADLEEAALTAVAYRTGNTEAARERVRAGTWTDDPQASAFVVSDESPRPSRLDRLLYRIGRRSPFQRRVRQTADAVYRVVKERNS